MLPLAMIVPLKSFSIAKSRLNAANLDVEQLARQLALGVLKSAAPLPTYVVTEADDVEQFARELAVGCLRSPTSGLNNAVTFAYESLRSKFSHVIIAHGDLRDPQGIGDFNPNAGVTVVTDQHGTGTIVLALPTGLPFVFQYGANSRQRHVREALRLEVPLTEITSGPWCFDVDEPFDLDRR